VSDLPDVLGEVASRVGYLRALTAVPDEEGWVCCDAVTPAVVDAALAGSKAGADRVVATSLFAQSYAFRVAAVSLAAYALGLPWPSPAAATTSVRLGNGRASMLALRGTDLGEPDDARGIAAALDAHLRPFSAAVHATTRLGARLVEGNIASSYAAAFRAVEGAAKDRGDTAEREAVRGRAAAFTAAAAHDAGAFAVRGDEWVWVRTSCCLWYRTSGRTCEDCSLTRSVE
jgi:hypothetical protein